MLACRPMLSLAVAVMAGILLERRFSCVEWFWPFGLAALAVAFFLFLFSSPAPAPEIPASLPEAYRPHIVPVPGFWARRGLNRCMLLFCLAALLLGMVRQHRWRGEIDAARLPEKRWFNARLVALAPSQIYPGEKGPVSIPARLIAADGDDAGNLRVRLRLENGAVFRRGDILHCRVAKMTDSPPAFPGAFDYGFFRERDGLVGSLRVEAPRSGGKKLTVTPVDSASLPVRALRVVDDIRGRAIRHTLDNGGDYGGLLAAMLYGYRKEIGEDVRDAFRRVGIGHVLAISGLHVGLVVFMFWWLGGWMGLTYRWRAPLCLVLTVFYWGLTGGQVAATRAAFMAVIHLAGIAAGRRSDMLNSLGAAAFLIALRNPTAPLDVSFQLSFTAVFFIYLSFRWMPAPEPERRTADPLYNSVRRRRIRRELVSLAWLSIATWVGLFPIIAKVFNQVNLAGLPINVAVIPLMSSVLAGGLLLPWLGWLPGIGWLLTLPSWLLTKLALWTDALPWSSFAAHAPASGWVWLFYVFAAAFMMTPMLPAGRSRRHWTNASLAGVAVGLLGIVVSMRSAPPPESGRIALLPGAGTDVIAAEAPNGNIALIGTIRRGGMNEASWLHYLHRKGGVSVLSVGKADPASMAALAWHYPVVRTTALPVTKKKDASAPAEWTEVPGAPGVEYALKRNAKGRVVWLAARTGDKTVTVMPRISVGEFGELVGDGVPGAEARLFSGYFSDAEPAWPEGVRVPDWVAVRGRMPSGAGEGFVRRADFGTFLLDGGAAAFDGRKWRALKK